MEVERAVYCQLQRLRTRPLVIEETNNLTIGTGAAQRKTLAALRRLSNTLSLAMAYFGKLEARMNSNVDSAFVGAVHEVSGGSPHRPSRVLSSADREVGAS
jgi:hypothetical protein